MAKSTTPSVGCVVVSNNRTAIGLHLTCWKTQPSALLTVSEAQEIVRQINRAIESVKGEDYDDIA